METRIDPCPTGDCRSLASCGVQVVLDVAFAASSYREKKACQQGIARTHLPHGCGEPDLGRAAHSWRVENAWLQYFRANCTALEEESPSKSRTGETVDGVSEQPS